MGNGKRTTINIIAQIFSFIVSLGVSFVLTPYISGKCGKDVYGFVGMAYQVTSYISVFTVAFNNMLGIFVATEYHKGKYDEANKYYSSVFMADVIIAAVLFIPMMLISFYMDVFLNVPENSVMDIKGLWFFIFFTFLLNLALGPWGISTFIKNRLELSAKKSFESNVIKAIVLVGLFGFFTPKVWYIGFASFVCGVYVLITNKRYMNMLVPEIKFDRKKFDFQSMKKLLSVGIWNTINQLTNILVSGLDLIISNKFISSMAMGYISYAQTVPIQMVNLITMISNAFSPQLTKSYATGDMDLFEKDIKSSIKVCGFICSIPILGFIAFGKAFYTLWIPSLTGDEVVTINILSFLILFHTIFEVYIYPLSTVNSITKKVKVPVLVSFICSIFNIIIELVLLEVTDLGVYSIEIATAAIMFLRVFFFIPIYSAKILKKKWYTFYPPMLRGTLSSAIILAIYFAISNKVVINSWFKLVIVAGICGAIGYAVNYMIVLGKNERDIVKNMLMKKLRRKK